MYIEMTIFENSKAAPMIRTSPDAPAKVFDNPVTEKKAAERTNPKAESIVKNSKKFLK